MRRRRSEGYHSHIETTRSMGLAEHPELPPEAKVNICKYKNKQSCNLSICRYYQQPCRYAECEFFNYEESDEAKTYAKAKTCVHHSKKHNCNKCQIELKCTDFVAECCKHYKLKRMTKECKYYNKTKKSCRYFKRKCNDSIAAKCNKYEKHLNLHEAVRLMITRELRLQGY